MEEHRKFLADRLLSEEQPITYRLLSRVLDVHVNTAKEMLFDFHQYQNKKTASSIHATYLLYGAKPEETPAQNGEDTEMMSSMPESEITEEIPTNTLSLVREEDLEKVLSTYGSVSSIHVYSLAPGSPKGLSLLSDIAKSVSEYSSKEDPLISGKRYGTIVNPKVRRRGRMGNLNAALPASASSVPSTAKPTAAKQEAPKTSPAVSVKQEPVKESPSASSAAKAHPLLKKTASGGIMQSFAKAASRPPKPKPEPKKEPDRMTLSDDGEADDSDLPVKKERQESEAARKTRKDREAELRRMMEASDDEEEEEEEEKADEEMEEEVPEPEEEAEAEPEDSKKQEEPPEVVSSKGDGRRRGRRRVTKKRRIQDEEGYMVTIQEQGWESFSEEDTPAPSKATTATSTPASSADAVAKGKKTAGKPGQGNIMSFFSKK